MNNYYLRGAVACVMLGLAATINVAQETKGNSDRDKPAATALEWGAQDQRVYDELAKPVEVEFHETPLEEMVAWIGERASMPVLMDHQALDALGIDSSSPITFSRRGTALQDTLRTLLRPLDLTFVVRDGVLVITSPEVAEQELLVRVFPVGDIASDAASMGRLVSVLASIVKPDTWEEVGGSGSLQVLDGMLVVNQTVPVLQELRDVLAILRSRVRAAERIVLSRARAFDEQFAKAMTLPSELDLFETPLADCAETIAEAVDLPVEIDGAACNLLGIDANQPITFFMDGITLKTALGAILGQHDLVAIPRDSAVVFTSIEDAAQDLSVRGYYIGDLVRGSLQKMGSDNAAEQVIEVLMSTVAPDAWEQVGGQGSVRYWPARQLILVMQSYDVHQKLAGAIEQIAAAQGESHATMTGGEEEPVIEVHVLPQNAELSAERVARLVRLYLHDVSWDSNSIQTLTDRVVVLHTPKVQKQVKTLIHKLVYGRDRSKRGSRSQMESGGGGVF